ncbi:MAG: hypothetical protein AAF442_04890 [Pseudomonadota bacterium]
MKKPIKRHEFRLPDLPISAVMITFGIFIGASIAVALQSVALWFKAEDALTQSPLTFTCQEIIQSAPDAQRKVITCQWSQP